MPINSNTKQNQNFSQEKKAKKQTGSSPSKRSLPSGKRTAPNSKVS